MTKSRRVPIALAMLTLGVVAMAAAGPLVGRHVRNRCILAGDQPSVDLRGVYIDKVHECAQAVREGPQPVILFSEADDPAQDEALVQALHGKVGPTAAISGYGPQLIDEHMVFVLKGRAEDRHTYEVLAQVAEHFGERSLHSWSWDPFIQGCTPTFTAFYKGSEKFDMGCGPISDFFTILMVEHMGLNPDHIRLVGLWSLTDLSTGEPEGILALQNKEHIVTEIYFPERDAWVLFDTDKGLIAHVDGEPASVATALQRTTAGHPDQVAFRSLRKEGGGTGEVYHSPDVVHGALPVYQRTTYVDRAEAGKLFVSHMADRTDFGGLKGALRAKCFENRWGWGSIAFSGLSTAPGEPHE